MNKDLEPKKTTSEMLGSKLESILGRQIQVFRVIFGTITSGLATDIALKLRSGNTLDLDSMIVLGIVWTILCIWFIITYRIEHWDEVQKTYILERNKAQNNRIDVFSDIRYYVMNTWLPNAEDDDQRIMILTALGNFMSMANVGDLKEDFAIIHTSIADALQMFMLEFRKVKSDIHKSMSSIMKKEVQNQEVNRKPVADDELFPKSILEKELK